MDEQYTIKSFPYQTGCLIYYSVVQLGVSFFYVGRPTVSCLLETVIKGERGRDVVKLPLASLFMFRFIVVKTWGI